MYQIERTLPKRHQAQRLAFWLRYLSRALFLCLSLSLKKKTKKLKYFPSTLAPAPNVGTMGTSNHDYGGVGMGAGARPSVPGKLFAKFDFRIRQNHVLEPRSRVEFAWSSRRTLRRKSSRNAACTRRCV